MKKKFFLMVFILTGFMASPGFIFAKGVGFYGTGSGGIMQTQVSRGWGTMDPNYYIYTPITHTKRRAFNWTSGGGLFFDSNISQDKVFNYRLQTALQYAPLKILQDKTLQILRFEVIHTFGMGIVRTGRVRFWLGTQIGNMLSFPLKHKNYIVWHAVHSYHSSIIERFIPCRKDVSAAARFGFLTGLIFGLNFHVTDHCSFIFDFGGRIISTDFYTNSPAYGYEGIGNIGIVFHYGEGGLGG